MSALMAHLVTALTGVRRLAGRHHPRPASVGDARMGRVMRSPHH
ncbi:hypothetical protein ACWGCI_17890 [Streptomyces sp. NPDC054949]